MPSYWQNPEETAATLRAHGPGPPWLHTGDPDTSTPTGTLFSWTARKT
jgi:long-subunit acyl-CoA synthetase (AMP-forming)